MPKRDKTPPIIIDVVKKSKPIEIPKPIKKQKQIYNKITHKNRFIKLE